MPGTLIFLGLGSNHQRERNLSDGLQLLAQRLRDIRCSGIYESAAVGASSTTPFLNLVVSAVTTLGLQDLVDWLKNIEASCGRSTEQISLDIDLLTYGDLVGRFERLVLPHPDISRHAFVLCPLAELAPYYIHPGLGLSFSALWDARQPGPALSWHSVPPTETYSTARSPANARTTTRSTKSEATTLEK
ncbi:2-amino-4-hydroxy-6-hydroxymethyldihydropteridine diphosphokinase [Pseudomonas sp. BN415]|nr:2-amino-4-hydroxy-6-hydroxymethyldihydropteridine diphosphokinase [Pseudomonas sp. BN415]